MGLLAQGASDHLFPLAPCAHLPAFLHVVLGPSLGQFHGLLLHPCAPATPHTVFPKVGSSPRLPPTSHSAGPFPLGPQLELLQALKIPILAPHT